MTLAGFTPPGDGTELTLELARRSHEPIAADKARNLAALRSRLGLPAGNDSATGSQPVAARPRTPSPGLAPWQQLVAVGAVTGALGFALGWGLSERQESTRQALTALPAPAALQTEPSAARALEAPVSAVFMAEPPAPSVASAEAPAAQARRARSTGARSAVSANTGSRGAVSRSTVSRSTVSRSTAAAAERSDSGFLQALQLLSRARRALERQEPALALALLDELDTRFARELLDEERAATRVFALCASGERDAALALARSWFVARPRSIYTRRLEQSCAREALR